MEGRYNVGCRIEPEIVVKIEALIWKNHIARYQDLYDDLSLILPKEKIPTYWTLRNYAKAYRKLGLKSYCEI